MSMIDVTSKPEIHRLAKAKGFINLRTETIKLIKEGNVEKGDPLSTAKIAGILAAKKTCELIPLCHPVSLTNIELNVNIVENTKIEVESIVKTRAQTGVEMEALVATTVALLTIWDMIKKYEKDEEGQYPSTLIQDIRITSKVKSYEQDNIYS